MKNGNLKRNKVKVLSVLALFLMILFAVQILENNRNSDLISGTKESYAKKAVVSSAKLDGNMAVYKAASKK